VVECCPPGRSRPYRESTGDPSCLKSWDLKSGVDEADATILARAQANVG
jgi:hypothetical protein